MAVARLLGGVEDHDQLGYRPANRLAPLRVLSRARAILGPEIGVQGNLDPAALMAPTAELLRLADGVLAEAGPAPGHIFNLGHGIEPVTDPDQLARLVDPVPACTATGANSSSSGGRP